MPAAWAGAAAAIAEAPERKNDPPWLSNQDPVDIVGGRQVREAGSASRRSLLEAEVDRPRWRVCGE